MNQKNKFPFFISIAVFCLIVFFFADCKKYPDGPSASLRSRATRLATTWYIQQYLLNNSDQTSTYLSLLGDTYAIDILKNGTYHKYGNFPDDGTCVFGDKSENIYMQSYSANAPKEKYNVLRLEYKHLWLKHIKANGDVEEIHFVPSR